MQSPESFSEVPRGAVWSFCKELRNHAAYRQLFDWTLYETNSAYSFSDWTLCSASQKEGYHHRLV